MAKDNDNQPYLQNQALFESSCEHPTIAFMPDQIEYQSLSHKEIQKRHLCVSFTQMPFYSCLLLFFFSCFTFLLMVHHSETARTARTLKPK